MFYKKMITILGLDSKENPLLSLPDEILLLILQYLDIKSLGNIAPVCHRLKEFSESDLIWRRHLQAQRIKLPNDKAASLKSHFKNNLVFISNQSSIEKEYLRLALVGSPSVKKEQILSNFERYDNPLFAGEKKTGRFIRKKLNLSGKEVTVRVFSVDLQQSRDDTLKNVKGVIRCVNVTDDQSYPMARSSYEMLAKTHADIPIILAGIHDNKKMAKKDHDKFKEFAKTLQLESTTIDFNDYKAIDTCFKSLINKSLQQYSAIPREKGLGEKISECRVM